MCKAVYKRAGRALLPPQLCALHPLRRRGYALAHCGTVLRLLWWLQALLLASELRVKLAPAGLPASQCAPDAHWLLLVSLAQHCKTWIDVAHWPSLNMQCVNA